MNRWPGGGEGWLTAKGYSWLTGRPAVDNGVTDGQSPLLTALFLWPVNRSCLPSRNVPWPSTACFLFLTIGMRFQEEDGQGLQERDDMATA